MAAMQRHGTTFHPSPLRHSCSSDGINTPNKACRNGVMPSLVICHTHRFGTWQAQPLGSLVAIHLETRPSSSLSMNETLRFYMLLELFHIPEVSSSRALPLEHCPDMREHKAIHFVSIFRKTHKENVYVVVTRLTAFVFKETSGKKIHHLGHSCHVMLG